MKTIVTTLLFLLTVTLTFAQQAVRKEIEQIQRNGAIFSKSSPLQFVTSDIHRGDQIFEGLKQGVILNLNKESIEDLLESKNDLVSLSIPTSTRTYINLLLKKNEIFTPDFALFDAGDLNHPVAYTSGVHYRGIIDGDPSSLVAISVFDDKLMGMIATEKGNFVLGKIKNNSGDTHILYNDKDLTEKFNFNCQSDDHQVGLSEEQLTPHTGSRDVGDCVRIYIEINHDIVFDQGGVLEATDYITGLFNQSFVIYTNENLTLNISEIVAWSTVSPYAGQTSSSGMLSAFRNYREFINGDLGHLVSFDSAFGGVAASLVGVCNASPDQSKCFSGLRQNYQPVPVYTQAVFVVTHEMGHLLGSHHTHACVWNGNNTAIDGCGSLACAPDPPLPPEGGTIMSYCHGDVGSFINFNLGFGPQPGDKIRASVNAAGNCLTPCGQPTEYCTLNGASTAGEYINKVVLGSINNSSGNNNGYADYTSLSTNLVAGTSYTITLTPKFPSGHHQENWRVWIDYNHDYDWYDEGEFVGQKSGSNTVSITFTVPATAINTTTRLRVSMKYQGYSGFCGTYPFGEVEDYTVIISGAPDPTCSDGILNQGETGIDCGGPCIACPSCTDSIQNQNETGVDCGGVCDACPISDTTILFASYFETGMDGWMDGGPDVSRENSPNSYEGLYSIRLADNSGAQSAMTSPVFNLTNSVGVQISFHFYMSGMEVFENFLVLYNNGSGTWSTIGDFYRGTPFLNNVFYSAMITVPNFVPTSTGSFRIQCDASDNSDQVFIDAVIIRSLNGYEFIEPGVIIREVNRDVLVPEPVSLSVYPNPAQEILNIQFNAEIQSIRIFSLDGKVKRFSESISSNNTLDISQLPKGVYFLQILSHGASYQTKFVRF